MTPEEIKAACEFNFDQIAKSHEKIDVLQQLCKHEETYEGNYSWRIGCIDPATICSYCNKVIKIHNPSFLPNI